MLKTLLTHLLCLQLLVVTTPGLLANDLEVPAEVKEQLSELSSEQIETLKNDSFSDELKSFATNANNFVTLRLSENDRESLRILGYNNDEINSLDAASFTDKKETTKLKNRVGDYVDSKPGEIDDGVMKELVPGLAASVIGLSFASLLGIVIGFRCSSVPSALAFTGTSAAWVALEMMIWKGYDINMKDIKTLQEASKIPDKVKAKINRIKVVVESLESGFKASGLANYESFLEQKNSEIEELKSIVNEIKVYLRSQKDKQFGSLKSIQESIALAAETSRKKAKNAKIAAIGYTASAGIAAAEAFSAFGLAASCTGEGKALFQQVLHFLIPSAQAGFASVGDLDKIGIPVGAGLAAAYLSFEQKFADKIYTNPTSRAVVFTAMAGIAFLAATKLKKAADFLDKQAHEMSVFTKTIEDAIEGKQVKFTSLSSLVLSLKEDLLPKVQKIIETAEVKKEELDQLKDMIKEGAEDIKEGKFDLAQELEAQIDSKVEAELSETKSEVTAQIEEAKQDLQTQIPGDDFLSSNESYKLFDFFISKAQAATSPFAIPRSCFRRTRTFLSMDENCSCSKAQKCAKSYFPTNLKIPAKSPYVKELVEAALVTNQANNLILSKRADQGSKLYYEVGKKVARIETITNQLISKKLNSPFGPAQTSQMVLVATKSTKEALKEMHSQKSSKAPLLSARGSLPAGVSIDLDAIKRENTRSKLREHLRLASLVRMYPDSFESESSVGAPNIDQFNYSNNTIIQDPEKDLFEVIRLRYLKIYTGHRLLHLDSN